MERYTQAAPAKINLALDILGLRPDGYHEMRMVMQTVGLCDEVALEEAGEGFALSARGIELPEGKPTLEQRAAEAFFRAAGRPMPGLRVALEKRTPAYAGLGGGSADVAALLRLLRERYPALFDRFGPSCYRTGVCPEGRMSCGRQEEMRSLFPNCPEAVDNTQKVADLCNVRFEFGKYHLPEFKLPEEPQE